MLLLALLLASSVEGRSFVVGYYHLQLDGFDCGAIAKIEGGEVSAEVVTLPIAHDYLVNKHLGNVTYNDFTVTVSAGGLSSQFLDWMKDSFDHKHSRKNGAITDTDPDLKTLRVREFTGAEITSVSFPRDDGSGKDPQFVTISFRPATVGPPRPPTPAERAAAQNPPPQAVPHRLVFCADRLPCVPVTMEDFVVRPPPPSQSDDAGGNLEVPNLVITFPESHSEEWKAWFHDFVVDGNNDDAHEKTGELHYLDSNRDLDLLTLDFKGLGIFNISRATPDNNGDAVQRVRIRMYVEGVSPRRKVKCIDCTK